MPRSVCAYKAYKVWTDNTDWSGIVFALSRNEAKMIAMGCDWCEGAAYIDIRVKRMKELDQYYKGTSEFDWYDPELRLLLVRDYGWACFEPSWECDKCLAKKECQWHED